MRALADAERLRRFLSALSRETREDTAIYLTGGATAVLLGWHDNATIEPQLHRYPAIDPPSFRRRLDDVLGGRKQP